MNSNRKASGASEVDGTHPYSPDSDDSESYDDDHSCHGYYSNLPGQECT